MKQLATGLVLLALAGCAGIDWSHNVYEGIRNQREVVPDPTAAQSPAPQPGYDQYKRERDVLMGVGPEWKPKSTTSSDDSRPDCVGAARCQSPP